MVDFLAGLDFYKLTMSQLAYQRFDDTRVRFVLKNRGTNNLLDVIKLGELQELLEQYRTSVYRAPWSSYLEGIKGASTFSPLFERNFLRDVWSQDLPEFDAFERDGDLHVVTDGKWSLVTFWETIVMSAINDLYFRDVPLDAITEGHDRLSQKIKILRQFPDIKFSDFGTRRRFGLKWQETVINRLMQELPGQFIGTSNPHFAKMFDINPIGTFAHELPMVYGALADARGENPVEAQNQMFDDWFDLYGTDLSIALTDTFGSDLFFRTFGQERAEKWRGLRHDSGNPFEFGERTIRFYQDFDIDPLNKTIVFSDGLSLSTIVNLYLRFQGRVNVMFGWGTNLMNDVGVKPNNIVMKATQANGTATVKLSDDEGKHTGPLDSITRYQNLVREQLTPVA